jgi:hypothetical protein
MNKSICGILGLVGVFFSVVFYIIFLIIGFLQPGYSFYKDSVSELISGKYGWIQNINFLILIVAVGLVAFSLKNMLIKNNLINKMFYLILLELFLILIFPLKSNIFVIIHYTTTFLLVFSISIMVLLMIADMKKNLYWKKLVPYYTFVLLFNFIFGLGWFVLNYFQLLTGWLGLFQKIIILNMITWLSLNGYSLWKYR